MRNQSSIACLCLMLGLLLTPLPTRAQAASDAVHGWEGSITIPTYKLGSADPNPPFPLVSSSPVYPYTMLDDLTNDRVLMTYKAIYLENKYLKITILPQLGGHVYSVYDKIDHREVLYRDHVIKYGLVGPRGAWISGGMEFSFPFAHTTDTVSTVESVLHHNPDGSATAIVGALDWVSNMHWEIAITLRPDTARVEEGVTLFNSTPIDHLYLFWTNTAVKATDDAQYIYPMRETVFDDPYAVVQSWPMWKGVDRSWYKNNPSALAIFGRNVHRNFFGVYYHQSNYGVVHVANFRQDPGKKFWTWGTARSGKIWDKILSDNDGSYNEIQSGRFYTQGSREFMNPRLVEKWTEYWYPVRGLNNGFVEATSQMAINVHYLPSQVEVKISPVAKVDNATLIVKEGDTVLKKFSHIGFMPLDTVNYGVTVKSMEQARKDLNVRIFSAEGATLLHWSAAEPVDGNPDLVPAVGKAIKRKIDITPRTPTEELYFHGVFLEKTEDELGAQKIFDQVLKRDPGFMPALLKEAWYQYTAADFKKAEALLARARERDNDLNENSSLAYAEGVVDRAEGRMRPAKDAFWNAIHYGDSLPPGPTLAPAYAELGEIAIHQGDYAKAVELLEHAVAYNPNDAFALADLAAAERLSGNLRDAAQRSAEAIGNMPLLPYALAENWLDGAAATSNTSWTKILSSDPENYLAVAAWYYSIGAWESSDKVLHAAMSHLPAKDLSPMLDYYLAANARREEKPDQAEHYAQQAASLSSAQVFPYRLTDAAVLSEAAEKNPSDAGAKYALGNFLFAHARYHRAAELWTQALHQGMNNAVLLRNLGVYQWRVQKDAAKAAEFYRQAIQLNPNDYRLYTALDEIYGTQEDTAARTKLFADAPPAVLDQDTVRASRAILLLEQSKPDAALALLVDHHFKPWEGGVVIHKIFVVANMEKGKAALADHEPAQAFDDFQKATNYPENLGTGKPSHPDYSEQLYWMGNALQAEGTAGASQAAWKQAATFGSVHSALADKKLGNDEQAKAILDRYAQAAAKPNATAADFYLAGVASLYSGDTARAESNLQHALQLDPTLWQARMTLDRMKQSGAQDE